MWKKEASSVCWKESSEQVVFFFYGAISNIIHSFCAMNLVNRVTVLACLRLLFLTVTMTISETGINECILKNVTKRTSDVQTNSSFPKLSNRVGSFFTSLAAMKLFANRQRQEISISDAKRTTVGYIYPPSGLLWSTYFWKKCACE